MNKNQETADRLANMNLSNKAIKVISGTELDILYELFGDFETPEQVEEFINEYYSDEE